MKSLLVAILGLVLSAHVAAGQAIAPGTKVRVTFDAQRSGISRIQGSNSQVIGTLNSADSLSMSIGTRRGPRSIETPLIRKVEVSAGRHRPVAQYALIGAGSTALFVLVFELAVVKPLGGGEYTFPVYLIPVGGAVAGALAGAAFPAERWRVHSRSGR